MKKIIVMGLGNMLLSDEGLGVYLIEMLQRENCLEDVELIDGGTAGLMLLSFVEDAEYLLVLDVIEAGYAPGTVLELESSDIGKYISGKLSQHQTGFQEVLALAQLRGTLPREVKIIAVQPESLEWGCSLSDIVKAKVPEVIAKVKGQIMVWQEVYTGELAASE